MNLNIAPEIYFPDIGMFSDVGRERSNNQDNIGCVRFSDKRNFLVVVADGMGGHQGGEVASHTAVAVVQQKFSDYLGIGDYAHALQKSFHEANTRIYQLSQTTPELKGMGTTLVALAVIDGFAYYANAGDSRLYKCSKGECTQLSQDHTMVADMVRGGLLTPEAAENHPDRHWITRAIGTKVDEKVDSSTEALAIKIGDCFLLCSDGLYDLVTDNEISQIIVECPAQDACKQLVDLANERGGHDNISVIVVKIVDKPPVLKEAPVTRV